MCARNKKKNGAFLVRGSIEQKQIRNERVDSAHTKTSQSIIEQSLGRNSVQETEAGTELETTVEQFTGLIFMACAACFII